MEQNNAQEHVADARLVNAGTAYQQRRNGEHTDLGVGSVGGEVAHVLQVDDHAEAGKDGGHDHSDDTGPLHVDAGVPGHLHILANCPHILAQLGSAEPDNEQAGQNDEDQRQHRDLHPADLQGDQVVQALAHIQQRHGIADAVAPGQLDGGVLDGDNGAHHVQHHQLIDTGHEEGDHIGGDHFTALGLVQDLADEHTQADGNGDGDDGGQHQAGDPPDLPVGHKDQADLTGHSSQGHAEVQAHAGHNGDQQAQDQEGIPAQTGHDLVEKVAGGEAGHGNAVQADQDEHNGHAVVADEVLHLLPEGLFAQTGGIGFVCHFSFCLLPSYGSVRRRSYRWTR